MLCRNFRIFRHKHYKQHLHARDMPVWPYAVTEIQDRNKIVFRLMDFLIDVNENFLDHTFCFASVILHSLILKSLSDLAPAHVKVKP